MEEAEEAEAEDPDLGSTTTMMMEAEVIMEITEEVITMKEAVATTVVEGEEEAGTAEAAIKLYICVLKDLCIFFCR